MSYEFMENKGLGLYRWIMGVNLGLNLGLHPWRFNLNAQQMSE